MLEVLRDNIVIMFLDEFSNSQYSYRYKGSRSNRPHVKSAPVKSAPSQIVPSQIGPKSNRPQFKIIEELKLSSKYSYVLYQ